MLLAGPSERVGVLSAGPQRSGQFVNTYHNPTAVA